MNASRKQVGYALMLLKELGFNTRYMNKDFKILGAGMRERSGEVSAWLGSMNVAEISSLIDRLKEMKNEAAPSTPIAVEEESPTRGDSLTLSSLHAQVEQLTAAHRRLVEHVEKLYREKATWERHHHLLRAHNRHVFQTMSPKELVPGRSRRAAQQKRTWSKRRSWAPG